MSKDKDLEKELRRLFLNTFTKNCEIEEAIITKEESATINEIDIFEICENLKDLINSLLLFKQEYLATDKAELIKRSEQFESMLQKLEAEVRNHIRVEHQLKLHIETNQAHCEELEMQNKKFCNEIKDLQEKIKSLGKIRIEKNESKDFLEKIYKLEENLEKKEEIIKNLEFEITNLKKFKESPIGENVKIYFRKPKDKGSDDLDGFKGKFEEKAVGLQKLQKLIREKSAKPNKDRGKLIRNSVNDSDFARNKIEHIKIASKLIEKSHVRSTSEHVRPKSVGKRSPSR